MVSQRKLKDKTVSIQGKTLPNNIEAEQSVLGCLMSPNKETSLHIISMLTEDDFFANAHKIIFSVAQSLFNDNKPVDFVSLTDTILKLDKMDEIGGIEYLTKLSTIVPSVNNYKYYVDIVKRDSVLRQVILMCQDVMENAYTSENKDQTLAYAEKRIFDIAQREETATMVHIKEASKTVFENLLDAMRNKGQKKGVLTGFYGLDKLTNGFGKNDLIILAARPAVGKTSFAMNVVDNAAKLGYKVAVFSLEMSKEQLAQRMLCSDSIISMSKAIQGELDINEAARLMTAVDEMENKSIYIYDKSEVTPAIVRTNCERLKKEVGLDLIMIDYLQLMQSGERKRDSDNRQNEVADITRKLKITCRELNVPILLLSQLNRAADGHRPQISNLRESGAIEQDADIVMFLHRPADSVDENDKNENSEYKKDKTNVELIIAKHRNGACDTINLKFHPENTTFKSTEKDKNAESLERNLPNMEKFNNIKVNENDASIFLNQESKEQKEN